MVSPSGSDGGNSADLAVRAMLSTEDYASIKSFEDAVALVTDKFGGEVVSSTELGDGFALLNKSDKDRLIGVQFIILSAVFSEGDYKREDGTTGTFVSLRIVTKDGGKFIVNDGGSGIHDQIKMLHSQHPDTVGKPIACFKGLRKSEYDHPEHGKSVTYYLDTSAQA